MKAISLFSGVGGIDLAFERAGIETVLQAERDKWCNEVLARHWPQVARVDDVRDVGLRRHPAEHEDPHGAEPDAGRRGGAIDLVYGGFPCQPFSVAGKRGGAADERDGWPEFRRVVSELRPRWVVAENVRGLLSIAGGRYFGQIIGELDDLGFDAAWAVLDAQHFGVPQRRRRVFIVAGPRGRGPEQVLAICEGCGGNPAAGRAAGEGVAGTLGVGAGSRGWSPDTIAQSVALRGRDGGATAELGDDRAYTLDGAQGQAVLAPGLAYALAARNAKGVSLLESQDTFVVPSAGVRRLTPLECLRLQGFPDDWDRWTADGREIADSHRYRMMGNAVCVPVLEWLGRRLVAVDAMPL